jgi:hypothetical protein
MTYYFIMGEIHWSINYFAFWIELFMDVFSLRECVSFPPLDSISRMYVSHFLGDLCSLHKIAFHNWLFSFESMRCTRIFCRRRVIARTKTLSLVLIRIDCGNISTMSVTNLVMIIFFPRFRCSLCNTKLSRYRHRLHPPFRFVSEILIKIIRKNPLRRIVVCDTICDRSISSQLENISNGKVRITRGKYPFHNGCMICADMPSQQHQSTTQSKIFIMNTLLSSDSVPRKNMTNYILWKSK